MTASETPGAGAHHFFETLGASGAGVMLHVYGLVQNPVTIIGSPGGLRCRPGGSSWNSVAQVEALAAHVASLWCLRF